MLVMFLFVALIASIHEYAPPARKICSPVGLCVAVVAAAVLLLDYFIQVTVMQPSLEKGQLEGWAILTQYNPNGVLIALEELGYLLMSLALLCLAPVFAQENRAREDHPLAVHPQLRRGDRRAHRRLDVTRDRSRRPPSRSS
jgi:hypothetical protein